MASVPHVFCSVQRIAAIALLLGVLIPLDSSAAIRCINDVTQVQSVMDAALASADSSEDIRFKEGIYNFTTGDFGYFGVLQGSDKVMQISGGWSGTPGNCTSRSSNVGATILWGQNERRVLVINASQTFTGSIIVENLTIGGGFSSGDGSLCLGLGEQEGGVMGIRVERVLITQCTVGTNSGIDAPAVRLVSSSALLVRNNVIESNSNGTGVIFSTGLKGGAGYILNNTIVNNTTGNVNGFVALSASASEGDSLVLGNNLFDLNTATAASRVDIRVGANVTLKNNRFTGLSGVPVSNTGSSSGPAGFFGTGYDLAKTSPARDAGAFFAPIIQGTLDIAGQWRIYGNAVDLGAFEFTLLFEDGFETATP